MAARPLGLERLEGDRLVGLRGNIDEDDDAGIVAAGAPLSRERALEPLAVPLGDVLLELGLLPVLPEGRREALDHLRVLGRAHPHIPLESLHLRGVGEVRRADVGGVKAAVPVEEPRLGVKPGPGHVVGDLHPGPEPDEGVERAALR